MIFLSDSEESSESQFIVTNIIEFTHRNYNFRA